MNVDGVKDSSKMLQFVSSSLNRQLMSSVLEVVSEVVKRCGERYNFDVEEAMRMIDLDSVKSVSKSKRKEKLVEKCLFPLPYNGELDEKCCNGLKQNHGLYTQCLMRKGDSYCKVCKSQADKNETGEPDYGTIQGRNAVGIFAYIDPKGKSPTSYTKIMKKYKVSREEVLAAAAKVNMTIDEGHFAVQDSKRGRPKSEAKLAKAKGTKGRPKKSKKVIEIEGDEIDLFAALVAASDEDSVSNEEAEEAEEAEKVKEAEKEAKKIAKEAEKKAAKEAEKAAKEAEKAAEKAKKEAEKEAEKAKKEAEKAEKAAEKAKKEAEKAAKEAEKEAKKLAKEAKEAEKPKEKEPKKSKEPEKETKVTVHRFTYEDGNKYLKSKETGIVYNQEQDAIGKWNEETKKIEFNEEEEEEEEEEYEE